MKFESIHGLPCITLNFGESLDDFDMYLEDSRIECGLKRFAEPQNLVIGHESGIVETAPSSGSASVQSQTSISNLVSSNNEVCSENYASHETGDLAFDVKSKPCSDVYTASAALVFYIRLPHSYRRQHIDVYTISIQSPRTPDENERIEFRWTDRLPTNDVVFGNIDILDSSEIRGWYRNKELETVNTLSLYINGNKVTKLVCDQARHDVALVFGDDFLHSGFSYRWPLNMQVKSIELRELDTEISVLKTPISIDLKNENCDSNSYFKELASFFDPEYYLVQLDGIEPNNPFQHYLNTGWQHGLDPSEAFSTAFYLRRHDDIRKCGMNPLEHYALYGNSEGREVMPSSRVDKAILFLVKSNNLSASEAQLVVRAHLFDAERNTPAAFSIYEYLKEGWRDDNQTSFLSVDGLTDCESANTIYTADEMATLLHAAKDIFANEALIKDLNSLCRPDYYEKACKKINLRGSASLNMDTVSHYIAIGRHYRLSLSPLFSIFHYLTHSLDCENTSLSVSPENALFHYLEIGETIGYRPCTFFNPTYYKSKTDTGLSGALVHFVLNSADNGVQPSPAFWSEWYTNHHEIETPNALTHFYEVGLNEGLIPNPLIDLKWYTETNKLTSETEALSHYASYGFSNDDAPHPLISPGYIKSQHPQKSQLNSRNELVLEYYFRLATTLNPHPLFQTAYYIKQLKTNKKNAQPLYDYLTTPEHTSKYPNPYFCNATYLNSRPDVANSGQTPLMHYQSVGYTENTSKVHPLVDHNFLKGNLKCPKNVSALEYILSGHSGPDFRLRPEASNAETNNNSHWLPVVLDIDHAAESYAATPIEKASVGILAHVYYTDLLHEIICIAENVTVPSILLISTDSEKKKILIETALQRSTLANWEIRVFDNRGRDIAPSFFGFLDKLENLDYAVHLHTKRSPHYGQSFDKWREYLFAENGGSRERVESILRTFEANPTLGALAPADFGPIRRLISWGNNRDMVTNLLQLVGDTRPLDQASLELPSGSMFWFRTKALRSLFDSGITTLHFDPESGQTDGTLAHAIERSIFYLIENQGYDWARFCSGNRHGGYEVTDDIRFARSRLLPKSSKNNSIAIKFGETSPFNCRAINNPRPRLNLLIPTADLNIGYAGVSEAIRQYQAIGESLRPDVDLRIITTDFPFNNMTIPPTGFVVTDNLVDDRDMIVVPGYLRNSEPIGLRPNDIFMASAWWNAHQAFNLLKEQAVIFETEMNRRIVYLVQDFEPCFYPWSTRWALAERTYQQPEKTIAVFNTPNLSEFMCQRYNFSDHRTYHPMINEGLMTPIAEQIPMKDRDNTVLLYSRPHAERNCLELIDAIVAQCIEMEPEFWADWDFVAIGEDFKENVLCCDRINVAGRLSINKYREFLQTSKLGISLMVSPHPSYPPLEMAANGMKVLTNTYENKDLSNLHENISSFTQFDPTELAKQLKSMALSESKQGKPLVDWFFAGANNLDDVAHDVSGMLREDLGISNIDLAA